MVLGRQTNPLLIANCKSKFTLASRVGSSHWWHSDAIPFRQFERDQRADFGGRQMGGLCVERIGRMGNLRHHFPGSGREMGGISGWWARARVGRRLGGNLL